MQILSLLIATASVLSAPAPEPNAALERRETPAYYNAWDDFKAALDYEFNPPRYMNSQEYSKHPSTNKGSPVGKNQVGSIPLSTPSNYNAWDDFKAALDYEFNPPNYSNYEDIGY